MRAACLVVALAVLAGQCSAYFRGDPVQAFKRMQYNGKRSVWSDVLVGQGPLFDVDRAVRRPITPRQWAKLGGSGLVVCSDGALFR